MLYSLSIFYFLFFGSSSDFLNSAFQQRKSIDTKIEEIYDFSISLSFFLNFQILLFRENLKIFEEVFGKLFNSQSVCEFKVLQSSMGARKGREAAFSQRQLRRLKTRCEKFQHFPVGSSWIRVSMDFLVIRFSITFAIHHCSHHKFSEFESMETSNSEKKSIVN